MMKYCILDIKVPMRVLPIRVFGDQKFIPVFYITSMIPFKVFIEIKMYIKQKSRLKYTVTSFMSIIRNGASKTM